MMGENLKCEASNTNLTTPLRRSITVDMYLKPTSVNILDRSPLKAGHRYKLLCKSSGSKPPANITWWMGNNKLESAHYMYSEDKTTTTSVLNFEPNGTDNQKFLACRAQNVYIAGSAIEDGYNLQIYSVPHVTLEIEDKSNVVVEKTTVYFKCIIQANPWVTNVGWRYNGRPIVSDFSSGISIGNQSLVASRVSRHQKGIYSCVATNSQGEGQSNPIKLIVQYAPICAKPYKSEYGLTLHETASILCKVDADPPEVDFKWTFNSSSTGRVAELSSYSTDGLQSIAVHMPRSEYDYGQLNCYGRNSVGFQSQPCIFNIALVRFPGPLRGCHVSHRDVHQLTIRCQEGFDGGVKQRFTMEIYDLTRHKIVANVTSNGTIFTVDGLPDGSDLQAIIYAHNKKGRGNTTSLITSTLPINPEDTVSVMDLLSPALTVIVIVICSLLLITALIISIVKIRNRRRRESEKQDQSDSDDSRRHSISGKTESGGDSSSEKKSPDLIPSINRSNSGDIFLPTDFESAVFLRGSESPMTHFSCCEEASSRPSIMACPKRRKANHSLDENLPGISSITTPNWRYNRPVDGMVGKYEQNELFRSSNIRSYIIPQSPSNRRTTPVGGKGPCENDHYYNNHHPLPPPHHIHHLLTRENCDDDSGISSETPLMTQKVESAV